LKDIKDPGNRVLTLSRGFSDVRYRSKLQLAEL